MCQGLHQGPGALHPGSLIDHKVYILYWNCYKSLVWLCVEFCLLILIFEVLKCLSSKYNNLYLWWQKNLKAFLWFKESEKHEIILEKNCYKIWLGHLFAYFVSRFLSLKGQIPVHSEKHGSLENIIPRGHYIVFIMYVCIFLFITIHGSQLVENLL